MSHILHGMVCGRTFEELGVGDKAQAAILYHQGLCLREIAKSLDITQKAVRQVMVELDVQLRGRGGIREKAKPIEVVKGKVSSIALGRVVRDLRLKAEWTMPMMGQGIGVPWTRIESYERGSAIPPTPVLGRMETVFGLPSGEIMRLAQATEFPFCTIPSQRASRQVAEAGTCPSMFCCYCSDARRIPAECKGVCLPRKAEFDKCPERVRAKCPCYSPVTAERKAEYEEFMAERRREEDRFGKYRIVAEEELEEVAE